MRMTATCSRVTVLFGAKVVGDMPSTTPVLYAQATASRYQPDAASVNGTATSLTSGLPSKLYSTCTSCARVVTVLGEKIVSLIPDMRPCRTQYSMLG